MWVINIDAQPVSDFKHYFWLATGLAAGLGYQHDGHPTAYWPPGYPAFLAIIFKLAGATVSVAKISNLFLSALTVVLAYVITERLADKQTATVAGALMSIHPDMIMVPALLASENLAMPLLLGAIAIAVQAEVKDSWSWRSAALTGALLGAAALTRPTCLLLIPLFAAVLLIRRRDLLSLRLAAVLCLAAALFVGPWVIRNAFVMGAPIFSTNGGLSLWVGNNDRATGGSWITGETWDHYSWQDSAAQEMKENSMYSALALTYIREHPDRWLALAPVKLDLLFAVSKLLGFHKWTLAADGDTVPRKLSETERKVFDALNPYQQNTRELQRVLWSISIVGLIVLAIRRSPGLFWVGLVLLYWVIFHMTLSNGQPRYLVVVTPLVLIGVAAALTWLARSLLAIIRVSLPPKGAHAGRGSKGRR